MKFLNEAESADFKSKKNRNKLAYTLIAFHHGVSYISQLAIQYFFKDELKVEPSTLATINSITHIPWAIKPLLGLITDLFPICGYRRKIYIILCGVINLLSWIFMTFYVHSTALATTMIFLVNLSLSFCSVLGEAVVVELSKMETENKTSKAKDFVSMFFLCRTLGELLSSYLKGLFVDIMPLRKIFLIASFVPLLVILAGCIFIESPGGEVNQDNENNNNNDEENVNLVSNGPSNGVSETSLIGELMTFMCQKFILIPLGFIIIFKATPSYYDAFFYFITNELKFTASDLGKISFCSTIAILIAIWVYKAFLKEYNFKAMISLGTIISFFVSFLCYILVLRINLKIGIPDFWLLLFTNSFLSLIGELVLLPILSLACVLCPKNLEGTVYSIFMSSLNLGGILSQLNGSLFTSIFGISTKNYLNLHWFILFAKFLSLLPLPILLCINNAYFEPKEEEHEASNNTDNNQINTKNQIDEEHDEKKLSNCNNIKAPDTEKTNKHYQDKLLNDESENYKNLKYKKEPNTTKL